MKGCKQTVVVDGYTRFCLTAIMVLMTVLIIGLWAEGPDLAGRAEAGPRRPAEATGTKVPMVTETARAQRDKIILACQQTNQRLDRLIRLLESGKLEVIVSNLEGEDAGKKIKKP
jgi:hypothetical protein